MSDYHLTKLINFPSPTKFLKFINTRTKTDTKTTPADSKAAVLKKTLAIGL
jgi:hypothetical protein